MFDSQFGLSSWATAEWLAEAINFLEAYFLNNMVCVHRLWGDGVPSFLAAYLP